MVILYWDDYDYVNCCGISATNFFNPASIAYPIFGVDCIAGVDDHLGVSACGYGCGCSVVGFFFPASVTDAVFCPDGTVGVDDHLEARGTDGYVFCAIAWCFLDPVFIAYVASGPDCIACV